MSYIWAQRRYIFNSSDKINRKLFWNAKISEIGIIIKYYLVWLWEYLYLVWLFEKKKRNIWMQSNDGTFIRFLSSNISSINSFPYSDCRHLFPICTFTVFFSLKHPLYFFYFFIYCIYNYLNVILSYTIFYDEFTNIWLMNSRLEWYALAGGWSVTKN